MQLKLGKPSLAWVKVKANVVQGGLYVSEVDAEECMQGHGEHVERVLVTVTRVPARKRKPCPK
jgi:hypothetical protein